MALNKTHPTQHGVDATYWIPTNLFKYDKIAKIASVGISGYANKAARDAGKTPLIELSFDVVNYTKKELVDELWTKDELVAAEDTSIAAFVEANPDKEVPENIYKKMTKKQFDAEKFVKSVNSVNTDKPEFDAFKATHDAEGWQKAVYNFLTTSEICAPVFSGATSDN